MTDKERIKELEAEIDRLNRNPNSWLKYAPDYVRIQNLAARFLASDKISPELMGEFESGLQALCLSHEALRKENEELKLANKRWAEHIDFD